MKVRTSRSARTSLVVLACTALIATLGFANPAGATTAVAPAHTAPFHGTHSDPVLDPTCPRLEGNEDFVNYREHVGGIVKSRIGPAVLKLDLCRLFSGAMGGIEVAGTFTISTLAGTLRGTAHGAIGFQVPNRYDVVLTVEHGSFLLSRITGTLELIATVGAANTLNGAVTSNLSFTHGWGRWTQRAPWALS